jgi:predicted aspartyl protease
VVVPIRGVLENSKSESIEYSSPELVSDPVLDELEDIAGDDDIPNAPITHDIVPAQIDESCNLLESLGVSGACSDYIFTIPVIVEAITTDALIDTGASFSLISHHLANRLDLKISECSRSVAGLGDQGVTSCGILNLSFVCGEVRFNKNFLVMPCSSMKHSLILGEDFLDDQSIRIDYPHKRLSAVQSWGTWEIYVENGTAITVFKDLPMYVSEDTTLALGEVKLVPVKFDITHVNILPHHDFYFDGSLTTLFSRFLYGEAGVLLPTATMGLLIGKHSGSRPQERIHKEQKIAYASSVVDVRESPEVYACFPGGATTPEYDIAAQVNLRHLTQSQQQLVLAALETTSGAFSQGDHDIGCAGVTQHRIELHDSTPIRQKPRRFPEPVAREIENQCDDLRKLNIIDYSKSPWSSPIVPIKKKDGSIRLCIDYRELNKVTKADRFPIPNMSDLVFGLHGMVYFTTLDLVKGYYQVPLHPDSAEYTAFSTQKNHYQFRRLSFGLKNAPGAFQREMQEVLSEFNSKQVLVYIDDILIMAHTFDEHLDLVTKVLATLNHYGMKIKPSKCCWFLPEVRFLGHMVGWQGVRKSDEYMDSVRQFPKPTTVKELRSFLGLVNFQRKFIPHCSTLCKPLTCLTGGVDKSKLHWTHDMDESFEALKEAICSDIELAYPDYSSGAAKLELATDASGTGAGACLSQKQGDDVRVIAYASTTFSRAQCNYSTIERELAAIRWAVKVFRGFLYGIPFLLFTDHRPLVYMSNMSRQNARLMRTFNELAEYDFEVHYRAGKDNFQPDLFSRVGHGDSGDALHALSWLPEGLTVIEQVPGGGDTMVDSMLQVLELHRRKNNVVLAVPSSSVELRVLLVNLILDSPLQYGLKPGRHSRACIKLMKIPGQLPSEVFLFAFASLYALEVWIHCEMTQPVIYEPIPSLSHSDETKHVHLQRLAGVHYNPLSADCQYQPVDPYRLSSGCVALSGDDLDCKTPELTEVSDLEEVLVNMVGDPDFGRLACSSHHTINLLSRATVTIGDNRLCALFDTGAKISLISAPAYTQLSELVRQKSDYSTPGQSIKTIGSLVQSLGRATLNLQFESGQEVTSTLLVVSDDSMPFCLIIGHDILKRLDLSIDYSSRSFCFGPAKSVVPFLQVPKKNIFMKSALLKLILLNLFLSSFLLNN